MIVVAAYAHDPVALDVDEDPAHGGTDPAEAAHGVHVTFSHRRLRVLRLRDPSNLREEPGVQGGSSTQVRSTLALLFECFDRGPVRVAGPQFGEDVRGMHFE